MKLLLLLLFLVVLCGTSTNTFGQLCGTTNVALGRPVTVPTQKQWHPGSDAVDGNYNTWWYADSTTLDTAYFYIDLGQSYSVCKVNIYWGHNGKAANYKIQTSTTANPNDWTDIATVTGNSADTNTLTVNGNGRYVRIYMTLRYYNWDSYQIMEFEIYNTLPTKKPVVNLTAPLNKTTTLEGNNLMLTATAMDSVGTISKVDFYNGTQKLGTSTSPPYSYTLYNIYDGAYTFKARAFNNFNDSTNSDTAHVDVLPSPPGWSLTGSAGTSPGTNFLGTTDNKRLVIKTNNISRMTVLSSGAVAIGSDTIPNAEALLAVKGAVYAQKIKATQLGWSDDVFKKDYKLRKLSEVASFINKHRHLPDVPSEKEVVGRALDLSETQSLLLKKIEELTLYIIEQNKELERQRRRAIRWEIHSQRQQQRSGAQIRDLQLQIAALKNGTQRSSAH